MTDLRKKGQHQQANMFANQVRALLLSTHSTWVFEIRVSTAFCCANCMCFRHLHVVFVHLDLALRPLPTQLCRALACRHPVLGSPGHVVVAVVVQAGLALFHPLWTKPSSTILAAVAMVVGQQQVASKGLGERRDLSQPGHWKCSKVGDALIPCCS